MSAELDQNLCRAWAEVISSDMWPGWRQNPGCLRVSRYKSTPDLNFRKSTSVSRKESQRFLPHSEVFKCRHRSTQCSPVRSISRPHKKLTTHPRETSWWPGRAVVRADDAGARKHPYWAELFRACVLSSATSCWKFELGRSFSRSGSIRPSASLYPR